MKVDETGFSGLYILELPIFADERGYFMESYNKGVLQENGIELDFVQDNYSYSTKGVMRGLHFQNSPHAQTKLIRVIKGTILDVVVDLRKDQSTFGRPYTIVLSAENRKQLLVPKGFAHGFSVLSQSAEVLYKCDEFYYPEVEGGILYNDPDLKIDWGIAENELNVSKKDKLYPTLKNAIFNF